MSFLQLAKVSDGPFFAATILQFAILNLHFAISRPANAARPGDCKLVSANCKFQIAVVSS